MLRSVAVVLQPEVSVFELGVLAEVFGVDRSDDGVPHFDYRVCAERPERPLSAGRGMSVLAEHPLSATEDADLVAVPSSALDAPPTDAVLDVLRAASLRGAYVVSVCSGAYALAEAGLLDGRRVATHWRYAADLASRYPLAQIDPDVLYAQDGNIVSSAGTAAGIDACLHLVRTEHGPAVANRIARRMVISPHRAGGQKQFVETPVVPRPDHSLQPTLDWASAHLAEVITIERLAARAGTSTRTLLRRFAAEVGSTPHEWVTRRRVAAAQALLEGTGRSIEHVAADVGFGSGAMLRHHFGRTVGITPTAYRRQFASGPQPAER